MAKTFYLTADMHIIDDEDPIPVVITWNAHNEDDLPVDKADLEKYFLNQLTGSQKVMPIIPETLRLITAEEAETIQNEE